MDAATKALIETTGDAGYSIQLGASEGRHVIEAIDYQTGETFVVRSDDLYLTVVELAQPAGIELGDG